MRGQWVLDSFRSLVSGLGVPGRDKAVSGFEFLELLTSNIEQLESLYRGNWIAKKIVDIPAFDAVRAWRAWDAEQEQIEKLEDAERSFGLQQKVLDALVKARLYGGSAMILGIKGDYFNQPLDLEKVKKDSLKFIHVVQKTQIEAGPRIRDLTNPWFGEPSYYMRTNIPPTPVAGGIEVPEAFKLAPAGTAPTSIWIHPSRVIRFVGVEYPDVETSMDSWGDSVLQSVFSSVRDSNTVAAAVASLVSDTKVDVFKIPGLTTTLSTKEGTDKLLSYLSNANVTKSTVNSMVLDSEIEWDRVQTTFTGLPEVVHAYLLICAAAADIPATRLLGREPAGMNATGDSDTRNYYDRLHADQRVRMTPKLNQLDEVMIRSVFGERDPAITYNWNSLWQTSDSEKADIAYKKAQTFKIDVDTALIPPEAIAIARVNQLVEDGTYPGLDQAMDEVNADLSDLDVEDPAVAAKKDDPNADPADGDDSDPPKTNDQLYQSALSFQTVRMRRRKGKASRLQRVRAVKYPAA